MSRSTTPPLVSIVVPCFDAGAYVGDTIDSVRAQDLDSWELVVVDDGSTDDSLAAARSRSEVDPRVTVLEQRNAGVHVARQRGFEATDPSSRYLVFLDADDLIEPAFLSTFVSHLDAHPEVGMVYGARTDIDRVGHVIGEPPIPARHVPGRLGIRRLDDAEPATPLPALVSGHEAIPSATMLRRSVFEQTHGWRRDDVVEDKDMAMQMALLAPVHFLPVRLTRYRHHDTNRSSVRFYESMDRLHELWWDDETLGDDLEAVRRAIAFDRLVSARTSIRSAGSELRRRNGRAAARDALRAVKRVGAWGVLTARVGRDQRRHAPAGRSDRPRVLALHLTRPSSSEAKVLGLLLRHLDPIVDVDLAVHPDGAADPGSHLHGLAALPNVTLHSIDVGIPIDPSKPDGRLARVLARTPQLWRRRRLLRLAADVGSDVVHTSQQRFDCRLGELVATRRHIPHVVHLHYNVGPLLRQRVRNRLRSCDAVVAVSDYVGEQAIAQGTDPERVTVILNTIEVPSEVAAPPTSPAVIGQTGRMEVEKGFVDTVDVFARVRARHPDARLLLVGDGPRRPEVERAIARLPDGVDAHITGWQPDVAPHLAAMTVFVNPSRGEPFGLTVLEAMAAGLPVIAYRDGGIAEIVVDGETGFLHPLGDLAGMARSADRLVEDPELRRAMGEAGRRRARDHFDPAPAGAAFSQVLLGLVAGSVSAADDR